MRDELVERLSGGLARRAELAKGLLPKPDISILSDQFLAEVRGLKHKNVAAELLAKLLKDEIKPLVDRYKQLAAATRATVATS